MKKTLYLFAIAGLFAFATASCESNESRTEEAGDNIEEGAEDLEDGAEETADDIEDAGEDAADEVRD